MRKQFALQKFASLILQLWQTAKWLGFLQGEVTPGFLPYVCHLLQVLLVLNTCCSACAETPNTKKSTNKWVSFPLPVLDEGYFNFKHLLKMCVSYKWTRLLSCYTPQKLSAGLRGCSPTMFSATAHKASELHLESGGWAQEHMCGMMLSSSSCIPISPRPGSDPCML